MLGFFSSSAINVLADGFALFLYKGGRMQLIISDILTEQDREAIASGELDVAIPYFDVRDVESLKNTLSARDTHFFNCLAWLIRNERLEIRIVAPKAGIGISHTKAGIFSDGEDKVGFDGSCNFSRSALIGNIECLTAFCSWDGLPASATIDRISGEFELAFNGEDENIEYISTDRVKTRIADVFGSKEIKDLLEEEYNFIQQDIAESVLPESVVKALERAKTRIEVEIERIKTRGAPRASIDEGEPRFPYATGPREYQKQAFESWKRNGQRGLFAMATGTGKTITSLNCLLEIYNKLGYYKAIILVPTLTLVEQWEEECRKFNFRNIVKVCSKNSGWSKEVSELRLHEKTNAKLSYIIISTYASFVRSSVFMELSHFSKSKLLLIADEAHNMGGGLMAERLNSIKYMRRIGLSATPERQFDDAGSRKLMDFFGCADGYTFKYSMVEAIETGALCRYYYYPHIVRLTDTEMLEYAELTRTIAKTSRFTDAESQERLKMLFLKRKRLIHKASNKLSVFRQILQERMAEKGSLKYTLVYVPEGNQPDDNGSDVFDRTESLASDLETEHLIDEYTRIVRDMDPRIVVRQYTSESTDRDAMLKGFAEGSIDVLTSMKCLDEGVDVPRSELAIFCASTGNPRQFIQRRGRVLRTHKDKRVAIIHDLVVVPDGQFDGEGDALEKSLVENELRRVRDFASLSENLNDTDNALHEVLTRYNLSIFKSVAT